MNNKPRREWSSPWREGELASFVLILLSKQVVLKTIDKLMKMNQLKEITVKSQVNTLAPSASFLKSTSEKFTPFFFSLFVAFIFISPISKGQDSEKQNSIFWRISGKELSSPSYLFGTFHLLNGNYLNKMEKWKSEFEDSEVLIVEMVLDSNKIMDMVAEMISPDTTLDKLLTKAEYDLLNAYFKEVSGSDLEKYNALKPISLSVLLTTYTWAKLKPEDYIANDLPMDLYFVKEAKAVVKEVIPLETMEQQAALLYNGTSLIRQKELLMEMVNDREKTEESLLKMDKCYRDENLDCLQEIIFHNKSYSGDEIDKMLKDRNIEWMNTILPAINVKKTFIAVGAGHLPGEFGLISLLRKEGYSIEPIQF
ncbi:MAG TPA: TraB/GumN family protein [Cytophagales bacterium]|nr:TraB/GumN family protein [Cytophagales bacterium]